VDRHLELPLQRGMPQRGPPVAIPAVDIGAHREQPPERRLISVVRAEVDASFTQKLQFWERRLTR
jgi:hypothetical protein